MSEQDLLHKIEALEATLNSYRERETKKAKQEYEKVSQNIQDAIFDSQELENRYEEVIKNIELADFMLLLGSANNPTNDNLGFNTFNIIMKIAEETLASELKDSDRDKPKTRFLDIVSKVINNPIADILLKSNPVGAVVTNVMNVASNFINTTAGGGVLKKAYAVTNDVIKKDRLNQFSGELKQIELFYSQLLSVTNNFRNRLDDIESKNINLKVSLIDYYERFLSTLGINSETRIIDQFNEIFKLTEVNGGLNYLEVLAKQEIIKASEIVEKMPAFESQVSTFIREFEESFVKFVNEYIQVLDSALTWEDYDIDKEKLTAYIAEIKRYRDEKFQITERVNPTSGEVVAFSIINPSIMENIA